MRGQAALTSLVLVFTATQALCEIAPAFLWSSETFLQTPDSRGSDVSYETISSGAVKSALSGIGDSKWAAVESSKLQSNLVTIFLQGQATKSDISAGSQSAEAAFLQQSLTSASSSLYLANVKVDDTGDMSTALQLGSCRGQQGLSLAELKPVLRGKNGRSVLEVCEGTSLEVISKLQSFLQESQLPYVMAYFGQPEQAQELQRPIVRTLLASNQASQKLCDGKCKTQVRLFETIILLVILLLALWIGMNMLHILDAPTRFETEKKDQNRHQD